MKAFLFPSKGLVVSLSNEDVLTFLDCVAKGRVVNVEIENDVATPKRNISV